MFLDGIIIDTPKLEQNADILKIDEDKNNKIND